MKRNPQEALRLYQLAGEKGQENLIALQDKLQETSLNKAAQNRSNLEIASFVIKDRRKEFVALMNEGNESIHPHVHDAKTTQVTFSDIPHTQISIESYKQLTKQQTHQRN